MVTTALDSSLLRMVRETPTQYWNDSCAVEELAYAVEGGRHRCDLEPKHRAGGAQEGGGPLGAEGA